MLRLSEMFESQMVFQQGRPVPVWGLSDREGATVCVGVAGQEASAIVRAGRFRLTLPALPRGGPYLLRVECAGEVVIVQEVWVGEVWLAGGQSNMEMPLFAAQGAKEWLAAFDEKRLHLKTISRRSTDQPKEYGFHFIPESSDEKPWQAADRAAAARFSAIGCVFGTRIAQELQVPVGIISCNYGGTKVQPWVSPETLQTDEVFAGDLEAFDRLRTGLGEQAQTSWAQFQSSLASLLESSEDFLERSLDNPLYYWQADGKLPWPPQGAVGDANEPCCLWRHMVSRVAPFGLRGVLWYQGESSATREDNQRYGGQMRALIRDWRRAFENDELHWAQMQLAGYDTTRRLEPCDWPLIREAQRRLCKEERNVTLTHLIDLGEARNIHPVWKIEAGSRLADTVLHTVYGREDRPLAPQAQEAKREGEWVRIRFAHGQGLCCREKPAQLEVNDGQGFAPVDTLRVEDGSLMIRTNAAQIRYGWHCQPEGAIRNQSGLAAAPFLLEVEEDANHDL